MPTEKNKISRKKILGWMGILSLTAMAGAAFKPWKTKKATTVKMLTQDGRLVEIDASLLAANKKKISDKELQNWVKK